MPQIPLPQPTKPDIFSHGFDKRLNRTTPEIDSSLIPNTLEEEIQARSIRLGDLTVGKPGSFFGVDPTVGMWMGNEKFGSGTFRVDMKGNLTANSATIAGVPLTTIGTFGGDGTDGALQECVMDSASGLPHPNLA